MKLVLEKWKDGAAHCYIETEKHYKRAEQSRSCQLTKIVCEMLDYECNIDHMQLGTYMVFNIKR